MPVNLDALIRYHTIDNCLQNHFRKWTWDDLSKACFSAMDNSRFRSEKSTVSRRTIENDIRIMRSELLGYNAPIICKNSFYSYSDKNYSIRNATLSQKDIESITLAAKVLGQYKGFSFFEDLTRVLEKIETRVQVQLSENLQKIVQFEHIPESIGIEYIHTIMNMITSGQVAELTYKRFNSKETKKHILHPYLLKEYRNRWYVLGLNHKHAKITTYALDRISHIEEMSDIDYIKNTSFNPDTYFKDTIGVTYSGEDPVEVILKVTNDFVPYLLTQPLHNSQEIIETQNDSVLIKLNVTINNELETLLTGYSDFISIISPQNLRQSLINKLQTGQNKYF